MAAVVDVRATAHKTGILRGFNYLCDASLDAFYAPRQSTESLNL